MAERPVEASDEGDAPASNDEDSFALAMACIYSDVFFRGKYDSDIRTQVWDTSMVALVACIDLVNFEEP